MELSKRTKPALLTKSGFWSPQVLLLDCRTPAPTIPCQKNLSFMEYSRQECWEAMDFPHKSLLMLGETDISSFKLLLHEGLGSILQGWASVGWPIPKTSQKREFSLLFLCPPHLQPISFRWDLTQPTEPSEFHPMSTTTFRLLRGKFLTDL